MRTHSQIVRDHGAQALRRLLVDRGYDISPTTPQRWADRDSIPDYAWQTLAEEEVASLEELAAAAARKAEATRAAA